MEGGEAQGARLREARLQAKEWEDQAALEQHPPFAGEADWIDQWHEEQDKDDFQLLFPRRQTVVRDAAQGPERAVFILRRMCQLHAIRAKCERELKYEQTLLDRILKYGVPNWAHYVAPLHKDKTVTFDLQLTPCKPLAPEKGQQAENSKETNQEGQ